MINVRTDAKKRISPEGFVLLFNPTWTPDGTRLVFSGIDVNDPDQAFGGHGTSLYIVSRKRNGEPRKIKVEGDVSNPALAPRDDILVYQKETGRGDQLFKVNLAGGRSEQLTDRGRNYSADWFDPAFGLSVSPQPHLLTTAWGRVKAQD